MTTTIILTSGEQVKATLVRDDIYRLPGGRAVRTYVDHDIRYQDPDSDYDEDEDED